MTPGRKLVFIDTETTGLDPERHEIWEVAVIVREPHPADTGAVVIENTETGVRMDPEDVKRYIGVPDVEAVWQLPVDLARADTIALNIGHFHERRWEIGSGYNGISNPVYDVIVEGLDRVVREDWMGAWADHFARLTWGAHLIGMVPSFDESRLERLLRRHGACPGWHYQPVDVETLAVGAILGSWSEGDERATTDQIEGFRESAASVASLPWDSEDLSRWFGVNPGDYERHSALGDCRWARDLWDALWAQIQ